VQLRELVVYALLSARRRYVRLLADRIGGAVEVESVAPPQFGDARNVDLAQDDHDVSTTSAQGRVGKSVRPGKAGPKGARLR